MTYPFILQRGELGPPAVALVGRPAVRGTLSPEAVEAVARRHLHELLDCYRGALRRKPLLVGSVTVRSIVQHRGRVMAANASAATVPDRGVVNCFTRAQRRWSYPAPRNGGIAVVTQRFELRRDDS